MTGALTILLGEDDGGHATLIPRNLGRSRLQARVLRALDGLEVLRRIRADAFTCAIPVYMLTTTDNPVELDRCFELGCNAYPSKPVACDAFLTAIERLCRFLEVSYIPGLPERRQHVSA